MPSYNNVRWKPYANDTDKSWAAQAACDYGGCNYNNKNPPYKKSKGWCAETSYTHPRYKHGNSDYAQYVEYENGGQWRRRKQLCYKGASCLGSEKNSCGTGIKYDDWSLETGANSSEYFNNISDPYIVMDNTGVFYTTLDLSNIEEDVDDNGKNILEKMVECCNGNGDSTICGDLWNMNKYDLGKCNDNDCKCTGFCLGENCLSQIMPKYCKGDNLNTQVCIDWCAVDPANRCNKSSTTEDGELTKYCKNIYENNLQGPDYDNLCGCYYPTKYYTDIADQAEAWGYPPSSYNAAPDCISSACQSSAFYPKDSTNVVCPDPNNQICVQQTNITNSTISSDVVTFESSCTQSNTSGDDENGDDDNKAIVAIIVLLILIIIGYMLSEEEE